MLWLVCVFELWHCFECVLGCAGKNELSILDLELIDRYRHVVLAKTQEAARADDGVGDSFVGGDDNILDLSNPLVLVVVDRLTHDLPLRAPAPSNFSELCRSNADLGRARHLPSDAHVALSRTETEVTATRMFGFIVLLLDF
jgi:hypothetical protein